jgi:hypothetical protein
MRQQQRAGVCAFQTPYVRNTLYMCAAGIAWGLPIAHAHHRHILGPFCPSAWHAPWRSLTASRLPCTQFPYLEASSCLGCVMCPRPVLVKQTLHLGADLHPGRQAERANEGVSTEVSKWRSQTVTFQDKTSKT